MKNTFAQIIIIPKTIFFLLKSIWNIVAAISILQKQEIVAIYFQLQTAMEFLLQRYKNTCLNISSLHCNDIKIASCNITFWIIKFVIYHVYYREEKSHVKNIS